MVGTREERRQVNAWLLAHVGQEAASLLVAHLRKPAAAHNTPTSAHAPEPSISACTRAGQPGKRCIDLDTIRKAPSMVGSQQTTADRRGDRGEDCNVHACQQVSALTSTHSAWHGARQAVVANHAQASQQMSTRVSSCCSLHLCAGSVRTTAHPPILIYNRKLHQSIHWCSSKAVRGLCTQTANLCDCVHRCQSHSCKTTKAVSED